MSGPDRALSAAVGGVATGQQIARLEALIGAAYDEFKRAQCHKFIAGRQPVLPLREFDAFRKAARELLAAVAREQA